MNPDWLAEMLGIGAPADATRAPSLPLPTRTIGPRSQGAPVLPPPESAGRKAARVALDFLPGVGDAMAGAEARAALEGGKPVAAGLIAALAAVPAFRALRKGARAAMALPPAAAVPMPPQISMDELASLMQLSRTHADDLARREVEAMRGAAEGFQGIERRRTVREGNTEAARRGMALLRAAEEGRYSGGLLKP